MSDVLMPPLNEKTSFGSGVGAVPIHHGEPFFDPCPKTEAEPGIAAALRNRGPEGALVMRSGLNKKQKCHCNIDILK